MGFQALESSMGKERTEWAPLSVACGLPVLRTFCTAVKSFCLVPAVFTLLTFTLHAVAQTANQTNAGQKKPVRSATADKRKAALVELKLKEALRRSPDSFEANHNLGEFYIQQDKLTAAIPYLEKAQQLNPAHYANSYDLALAYFQTGNLPQARTQIQSTMKWKDTAELHSLLGDVEEKAGHRVAAAEEYQRAAQTEPSENHLLDLGNSLIKINAFDAAVQIFNHSLEKFPRSAKLRVGMGIAYYARGQYSDAVKVLCEAADLEPSDPRPYLFLGEMYGVSVEMADEITRRMAQFVRFHPKNALAHYYYAVNLWKGRRNPESPVDLNRVEALLKTAIALDPRLAQAHFELGILYTEQQKYPEAISELRKAVSLQPDLANAHYRLGQLYQRTGQKALATQEVEIFKRLKDREAKSTGPKKPTP
jgi:tetratricopeptide (TPR) repeat protein